MSNVRPTPTGTKRASTSAEEPQVLAVDKYSTVQDSVYKGDGTSETLNVAHYETLVNLETCKFFYVHGRQIKNDLSRKDNVTNFVKKSVSKDIYIVAEKECKNHTVRVTSLKMAIAACSFHIVREFFTIPGKDGNKPSLSLVCDDPPAFVNTLAAAHGISDNKSIYYWMYTTGLDFLVPECFDIAMSILIWRSTWRYHIFTKAPEDKEDDDNVTDFKQACVYVEQLASKQDLTVKQFLTIKHETMKPHLDYMSKIVPTLGSRRARAVAVWEALGPSVEYLAAKIKTAHPTAVIKRVRDIV